MQLIHFSKSSELRKTPTLELPNEALRQPGLGKNARPGDTRDKSTPVSNADKSSLCPIISNRSGAPHKDDALECWIAPDDIDASHLHNGWRRRKELHTLFLKGGHMAMAECEVLELLLHNSIPAVDAGPLSIRLIAEFQDIKGVIAASKLRIMEVDGATECVFHHLRVVEAFAHRLAHIKLRKRDIITSKDVLLEYCRTVMMQHEAEQFRVLFLGLRNELIADEAQPRGTINHAPVYPREVAKRALELNASAIIVVHHKPSSDPRPSAKESSMAMQLSTACEAIGVTVHDHFVIARDAEFSFKENGYLA